MNQDSPSSIYHQHGMDLLAKRSEELRKAIDAIQQGANADTKSTAGDKHETARAMAQLDVEMLSKQLAKTNKSIEILKRIPTNNTSKTIQQGSVVETSMGTFYLSVGLGNIQVDGKTIMAISTESPMAKAIMGKKPGDQIEWRAQQITVIAIQ
ncbi:MAG: GreA/GreB family elongation factor [Bacteroidota bacterium]